MSTRAVYTFKDDGGEYHVYKHCDGYPSGAADSIGLAIPNAWKFPRFEADEFAAAFVAVNKSRHALAVQHDDRDKDFLDCICRGGVRLMNTGEWKDICPADMAYRYEITFSGRTLKVQAWETNCDWETHKWKTKRIFSGSFNKFKEFVKGTEQC